MPLPLTTSALALLLTLTAAAQSLPTDAEIRQILTDRVDKYQQSIGIAVGVIGPSGRRIITYGSLNQNDPRPVTGDTLFEIGSITKLFTSLLLADMVKKGEVALNDPLSKYLPPTVKVPEHNGHPITLVDLSTHTSGLPRDPTDPDSIEKVYEFLASYKLTLDPGSRFDYSNLGVSLLGMALANRAGTDYATLLKSRILDPLSLNSTAITLSPELKQRLAKPHSFTLSTTEEFNIGVLVPAGAIRSTANDLLTFLAAELDYTQTPLNAAMSSMFDVTRPMGHGEQVHLAWLSEPQKRAAINWHNGATFGFQSFIGFDPKSRTGVVVLSNTHRSGVEDIGMHILNPKAHLRSAKQLKPPKLPAEISVDDATLQRYAGAYEFVKGDFYKVTPVDGHLQMDGPPDPIDFYYPESKRIFFSKVFDGEVTFKLDSKGSPTEFVWRNSTGTRKLYKRIN